MKKKTSFLIFLLTFLLNGLSQNLIINPGAESNPLAAGGGWTSVAIGTSCYAGSNWRVPGNQNGFPAAYSGTQFFYSGCGNINGEIYQDIDVSAYANAIDLSAQPFTFSGFTQSYPQNSLDEARMVVEYRDINSNILSTYDTGNTANPGSWQPYVNTRYAPATTRVIRIRLLSILQEGPSVDGYFDNLILTANSILPINLINFSATKINSNTVTLNWQTASEKNSDYFTVERSLDSLNWQIQETVKGAGNSSNTNNYAVTNRVNHIGTVYYRIKQTDFDGKYVYYNTIKIEFGNTKIEAYPNPTKDALTLSGENINLNEIKVYNSFGQDVTSLTRIIQNTEVKFKVDLSNLKNGIYHLKTKHEVKLISKQ